MFSLPSGSSLLSSFFFIPEFLGTLLRFSSFSSAAAAAASSFELLLWQYPAATSGHNAAQYTSTTTTAKDLRACFAFQSTSFSLSSSFQAISNCRLLRIQSPTSKTPNSIKPTLFHSIHNHIVTTAALNHLLTQFGCLPSNLSRRSISQGEHHHHHHHPLSFWFFCILQTKGASFRDKSVSEQALERIISSDSLELLQNLIRISESSSTPQILRSLGL